ncbi:MAG: YtxH domain-containing protein [Anaerolineaceae bacterium]
MSRVRSWFSGVVVGALVGSALALLFTPYSGEELKSRATDYLDNIKNEVENAGIEKRKELEEELSLLQSGKI